MKSSSLLRRLEAIERHLANVEQERVIVIVERRDTDGNGGSEAAIIIDPGEMARRIVRLPHESDDAFMERAGKK